MGAFDDLLPAQSGSAAKGGRPATTGAGVFDDLLPSASPARARAVEADGDQSWGKWLYDGAEAVGDAIGGGAVAAVDRVPSLLGNIVQGTGRLIEGAGDNLERAIPLSGLSEEDIAKDTFLKQATDKVGGWIRSFKPAEERQPQISMDQLWESPLKRAVPFAIEQGIASLPDMVAAVATLPLYVAGRTNEIGESRATNDGRKAEDATFGDLMRALPAATASAIFEKIGAKSVFGLDDAVGGVLARGAKSALKEGGTEAAQEGVEYMGEQLGTKKGTDWREAGKRMATAAVAGGLFGGAVGAGVASAEGPGGHAGDPAGGFDDLLPDGAGRAEEILDDVVVPVPADRERLGSTLLSDDDRASPIPNDLIDDGKAVLNGGRTRSPQAQNDITFGRNIRAAAERQVPASSVTGSSLLQPGADSQFDTDIQRAAETDGQFFNDVQTAAASAAMGDDIDISEIEDRIRQDIEEDSLQKSGPRPSFLDTFSPAEAKAYAQAPGVNRAIARRLGVKIDEMEARGDTDRASRLRSKLGPILQSFGAGTSAAPSSTPAAYEAPGRAPSASPSLGGSTGMIPSGDGSKRSPIAVSSAADLAGIAKQIAAPSEGQAAAGNYRKGHANWQGLQLAIETPKGGTRSGTAPDGSIWEVSMPAHYGDFKGTKGADGDPVDVYVGEDPTSDTVFVVDQKNAETGAFDEHKVFIGARDEAEVAGIYEGAFSDGRGGSRLQDITETNVAGLKDWLASGDTSKPFGAKRTVAPALQKKPVSAMLRKAGGVDPASTLAGELRSMGINAKTAPGLFRKGGIGAADNFVRSEHPLFEFGRDDGNGYIPEADILESLRREMAGDPLRTADEADRMLAAPQRHEVDDALDEARRARPARSRSVVDPVAEVDRLIDVYGYPDNPEVRQTAIGLIKQGVDPEDAMIAAYEDFTRQLVQPTEGIFLNEAGGIPFFDGDPGFDATPVRRSDAAAEADGEGIREDQPRDQEVGERRAAGTAGGPRDGTTGDGSERPASGSAGSAQPVEAGADGKPQLVIPGAERAPNSTMAQRAADAPMRSKTPQKSADDGLFGSSRDQLDVVEMAKKSASKAAPAAASEASAASKKPKLAKMGDRLRNYFQPGRIVEAYGGGRDEIVSFDGGSNGSWSVTVRDTETGRTRNHATPPSMKELAAWEKSNPTSEQEKTPSKGREEKAGEAEMFSEQPTDVPVATLDGTELGIDFRGPEDMPALRKAAARWYQENLRGLVTVMASGEEVRFNQRGRNKSTYGGKGDILLRAVPAIRAIIEKGQIVHREPGNAPDIMERIIVAAPINVMGVVRNLAVSLHRLPNGTFHYDFNFARESVGSPGDGVPGRHSNESSRRSAEEGAPDKTSETRDGAEGNEADGVDTKPRSDRGGPLDDVEPLPSLEAPLRRVDGLNLFERQDGIKDGPAGWDSVDADPQPRLTEAEQEAVLDIVRRVSGLSDVEFHDAIQIPSTAKGFRAWGREAKDGEFIPIAGFYHPMKDVIAVALSSSGDGRRLAFHESFHRLQSMFLTDQEKTLLSAETEALRAVVAGTVGREAQAARMSQSELEAEAFAIYSDRMERGEPAPLRIKGRIRAAWDRIGRMVRRVRNYLNGRGYQTFEDVFDMARSGEMKARGADGRFAKLDPSFSIDENTDVATMEPQKKTAGFLAKGQPIDRALRIPFEFFGGTDAKGEWKPGKYLTAKAAKIITEAKFAPDGRMSWMNGALATARAGLIDRYGLDAAYVERDRGRALDERAIMFEGVQVLKNLAEQNVSVQEAKVLQAILTGEAVDDADMMKLADPIRVAIDELGQEAVQLGLLSAESYERNRGAYLHRVYLKHEADQSGLTKMVGKIMGGSRQKIIGDQFKGRGMFFEVPVEAATRNLAEVVKQRREDAQAKALDEKLHRLTSRRQVAAARLEESQSETAVNMARRMDIADAAREQKGGARPFQKGQVREQGIAMTRLKKKAVQANRVLAKIDAEADGIRAKLDGLKASRVIVGNFMPVKGEKYEVLVKRAMVDGKDRVVQRVYVPTKQSIPAAYSTFESQGTWEVRGAKGDKVILWRDYTKAERGKMGEILDARYTIGKTYLMMAHDLATGRFYRDIAANPEWASKEEPAGSWKEAADTKRLAIDGELQWVRVPDTTIGASGGKKRWGPLAGTFVRAEIWRDLNEIEVMNQPTAWRMLLSQWKLNKTARSPVTHMNNVMSNLMFMDMADVRFRDLVAGIRSYSKGDADYEEAAKHGAFGVDMMAQEIRQNFLQPILDDIAKSEQDGTENSFLARAGFLGKLADRIWTLGKKADAKMIDAYRVEDEVFRMATYLRRRSQGDDARQAATVARETFMDYDIRAPWVNAARNSVLPFASYTYRAAPMIAKMIATRPWKLAKYFTIAYALNALAYAFDDEGDEDKERASLRDEEQGKTWLGVPRMMRMPFRNEDGLPVFLDVRRWMPAGDIFDTNQGSSAIPIPAPLQFGGPLLMGFEIALNKQGFTGEDIANIDVDTVGERAAKTADYLWKGWLPSAAWIPGSWYWDKIKNAAKGATDGQGRPYDLPSALASSVGIKLKPQDVESGLGWQFRELQKVDAEIKAEAKRLARQRERGLISQSAFDAGMATFMEKLDRVSKEAEELQRASSR